MTDLTDLGSQSRLGAKWSRHRQLAPQAVTLLVICAVIGATLFALDPALLLSTSTTTGGDTGAHFALAAYLKGNLLPHFHITGWDPGAYDGFPIYTFYFPLPDLLAALAGFVIPLTVAFKLVTILGSLTLPVAAWAFGRLVGWERPLPAVLAAATLPFLFDQSFTIYGGNLYSTLAGEYAYSLGLSLAVLLLGLTVRGIRTGRHRGLAALLLAVCVLCHLVAALFALAGIVVALVLVGLSRRRLWWATSVVGTGVLLVAWWAVPFAIEQPYSTNMGWVNVTTYAQMLAPHGNWWALTLATLGCVIALATLDRVAAILIVLGAASALALRFDPQGKLYNTRFLPLWWLCVYLLAGYAVAQLSILVATWWRHSSEPGHRVKTWAPGALSVPFVALASAGLVVMPPLLISPSTHYSLGPIHIEPDNVPGWAQWNYSGYEGKPAYNELENGVIATMKKVGSRYGCGRAMWEYNSNLNRFGTPMALMLLPYWTDNCVDSMEGLLFESAASTPYHFLNQSELSAQPSDAMVGLNYSTPDVALGVEHLQLLGVKYFMATSPSIQAEADVDPNLTLVATSGPWDGPYQGAALDTTWKVYLVHDAPLVGPLTEQPAVLTGVGPQQSSWLPLAQHWYLDPAAWGHELVAGGPSSWPVQSASASLTTTGAPLPPVHIADITSTADTLSFHVDRVGVPVVVRESYFPAWHATGATGPWRAEPNLMVVVPTSHDVVLKYGATGAGWLGLALTIVGIALLGLMLRYRSTFTVS